VRVSVVVFISLLPFSSYVALLPAIQPEWEMSNSQSALVFSSYLAGYAASSLLLVPLTDRYPAAIVLLSGVVAAVLANIAFPLLATDAVTASALRFAAGAGHVAVYVPGIQLVARRFANRGRATAVAVFVAASYAGTTVSYIVTGALAGRTQTWQDAYLYTALLGVAGIFLWLTMLPEAWRARERVTAPGSWRLSLGILRNRPTALMICAYSLHSAELYLARLWLPLLMIASLVRSGRDVVTALPLAAALSGLMFASGVAGVFLGGVLSDRVGRTRAAIAIFGLSGACSFVLGWLMSAPFGVLVVFGFLYGFATAADSAIYSASVTELAPAGRVGSSQAIQSFAGFSIGALAPVIAGSILDFTRAADHGWGLAFSFNGALAIAGVAILLFLSRMPEAKALAGGKR